MELTFSIGLIGLATLVVGALIVGVAWLFISQEATLLEATLTGVGAFVGGFMASEFIVSWRDWEPVLDGLAIAPALIGGLVGAALVGGVTRWTLTQRQGGAAEI